MLKQNLQIGHIPAILWGNHTGGLYLAAHGLQSHKEDTVIALFAACAAYKGHQVLSIDLPGHGARKAVGEPFLIKACVRDLKLAMAYAGELSAHVGVFGCSAGAYASLLACRDEPLGQALFLSPVVDMPRLVRGMMDAAGVTKARLRAEKEIATPGGPALYWSDYDYLCKNPAGGWHVPTDILCGRKDDVCGWDSIAAFARGCGATLQTVEDAAHDFHTEEELAAFARWCDMVLEGAG